MQSVWVTPEGGFAEGSFHQREDGENVIRIASETTNLAGKEQDKYLAVVMNHDVVHAVRALGSFTSKEWKTLVAAASKRKHKEGGTFLKRVSINDNMAKESNPE